MQPIMVVILAAIVLFLGTAVVVQRKKEEKMQIQINGLNEQLETLKTYSAEKLNDRETVLQAANTIYLYAALSEEEAQSRSMKEKQAVIRRVSETIIQTML